MAEPKDPAIKLFGKTIPLQDIPYGDDNADDEDDDSNKLLNQQPPFPPTISEHNLMLHDKENDMVDPDEQTFQATQVVVSPEVSDKTTNQDASLGEPDIPEALSGFNERATWKSTKLEEEKSESSASQDKNPRKPDKILPCPRCKSMDTKFCYYNNYNVNQPRHFCKNCQRYWTSGGTMRNVPVGAGRRKSKNLISHYRHITVPEALHNDRSDIPDEVHPTLPINGTVRTCNFDVSLCESMSSILNAAEKSSRNCQPSDIDGSNSMDEASQSSVKEAMSAGLNCIPFPNQIPCYPGSPWPYPWNSNQWSPPVAAPPFCPNGFPMPIYPTPAYWGCTVPGSWNVPWITQSSPRSASSPSSSPNSRIGKHSRDGSVLCSAHSEENNSEQSPWFPKTSRFHNPGEVAKSSVWTTLGINHNEKFDSIRRGSALFKGFQTKHVEGNSQFDTSAILEANPTALSCLCLRIFRKTHE